MAKEIHQLATTAITAHAFNADRSQVAVCENTHEVKLYKRSGPGWVLTHTLGDHDKLVTSIDWAPRTNRLVTASQDRNAYVWNFGRDPLVPLSEPTWHPTLVLLRLNRSATCVRWSPNEAKFAVASGARSVAICQFDEESNWWVAKHLKRPLRSTVLSLDWHPSSVLVAAGSADGKARVLSAFIKGVDEKPLPETLVWGDKLPFNTVCGDFVSPAGGWVHGVAFSPSGNVLAYVSHDCSISIVYPTTTTTTTRHVVRGTSLPFVTLCFIREDTLVAAGHDCQPVLFSGSALTGWHMVKSLDEGGNKSKSDSVTTAAAAASVSSSGIGRLNNDAFNHFRAADSRGLHHHHQGSAAATGEHAFGKAGTTIHQNTVTSVRPFAYNHNNSNSNSNRGATVDQISTTGVDGKLVIWDVAPLLCKDMAGLRV